MRSKIVLGLLTLVTGIIPCVAVVRIWASFAIDMPKIFGLKNWRYEVGLWKYERSGDDDDTTQVRKNNEHSGKNWKAFEFARVSTIFSACIHVCIGSFYIFQNHFCRKNRSMEYVGACFMLLAAALDFAGAAYWLRRTRKHFYVEDDVLVDGTRHNCSEGCILSFVDSSITLILAITMFLLARFCPQQTRNNNDDVKRSRRRHHESSSTNPSSTLSIWGTTTKDKKDTSFDFSPSSIELVSSSPSAAVDQTQTSMIPTPAVDIQMC